MDTDKDDTASQPGKPQSRRAFLATVSTAIAGTGLFSIQSWRNTNRLQQRDTQQLKNSPTHLLQPGGADITATLNGLKEQGYNVFCFGELDHASDTAISTLRTVKTNEKLAMTDIFIERPEDGKDDGGRTDKALGNTAWGKDSITEHSVEGPGGSRIPLHPTDSYIGPDHLKSLETLPVDRSSTAGKIWAAVKSGLFSADAYDALDRDVIYRNGNMAVAIAHRYEEKQARGEPCCFGFLVGAEHLLGPKSVPAVLAKAALPGMKVATIEVFPVKSAEMDGKVWQCSDAPDHFVVTRNDPALGAELGGTTLAYRGYRYQFPQTVKTLASSQPSR